MLLCFHETATEHDPFAIQVMEAGATIKTPISCDGQIFTNNNTNEMAIRNLHTYQLKHGFSQFVLLTSGLEIS